jgi:hypothetical protein
MATAPESHSHWPRLYLQSQRAKKRAMSISQQGDLTERATRPSERLEDRHPRTVRTRHGGTTCGRLRQMQETDGEWARVLPKTRQCSNTIRGAGALWRSTTKQEQAETWHSQPRTHFQSDGCVKPYAVPFSVEPVLNPRSSHECVCATIVVSVGVCWGSDPSREPPSGAVGVATTTPPSSDAATTTTADGDRREWRALCLCIAEEVDRVPFS